MNQEKEKKKKVDEKAGEEEEEEKQREDKTENNKAEHLCEKEQTEFTDKKFLELKSQTIGDEKIVATENNFLPSNNQESNDDSIEENVNSNLVDDRGDEDEVKGKDCEKTELFDQIIDKNYTNENKNDDNNNNENETENENINVNHGGNRHENVIQKFNEKTASAMVIFLSKRTFFSLSEDSPESG